MGPWWELWDSSVSYRSSRSGSSLGSRLFSRISPSRLISSIIQQDRKLGITTLHSKKLLKHRIIKHWSTNCLIQNPLKLMGICPLILIASVWVHNGWEHPWQWESLAWGYKCRVSGAELQNRTFRSYREPRSVKHQPSYYTVILHVVTASKDQVHFYANRVVKITLVGSSRQKTTLSSRW